VKSRISGDSEREEAVMDNVAVNEAAQQTQYLSFQVAAEEYAIGVLQVKEIIEYDTLTGVPQTPAWIRGVINLRGSVVPVIDLAVKFSLPETQVTKLTCIIIVEVELEGEPTVMGLMVDAVSQVIDFQPAEILEPPAFGTHVNVDYLQGMGRAGKKFVLILDIDKVLSAEELQTVASIEVGEKAEPPEREKDQDQESETAQQAP